MHILLQWKWKFDVNRSRANNTRHRGTTRSSLQSVIGRNRHIRFLQHQLGLHGEDSDIVTGNATAVIDSAVTNSLPTDPVAHASASPVRSSIQDLVESAIVLIEDNVGKQRENHEQILNGDYQMACVSPIQEDIIDLTSPSTVQNLLENLECSHVVPKIISDKQENSKLLELLTAGTENKQNKSLGDKLGKATFSSNISSEKKKKTNDCKKRNATKNDQDSVNIKSIDSKKYNETRKDQSSKIRSRSSKFPNSSKRDTGSSSRS